MLLGHPGQRPRDTPASMAADVACARFFSSEQSRAALPRRRRHANRTQ
ncbi:hypothetical protein BURMUCGD1_3646 [Burkholderia multivorans CGD1]|nr:hypothetical protein BURMUCGD1_3646 [Burkholderia multivorans CGD1]